VTRDEPVSRERAVSLTLRNRGQQLDHVAGLSIGRRWKHSGNLRVRLEFDELRVVVVHRLHGHEVTNDQRLRH